MRSPDLDRSGPWIGVGSLFILLWLAISTAVYAPWWGVLLQIVAIAPSLVLVVRWSRTHPRRCAWVPVIGVAIWLSVTTLGVTLLNW